MDHKWQMFSCALNGEQTEFNGQTLRDLRAQINHMKMAFGADAFDRCNTISHPQPATSKVRIALCSKHFLAISLMAVIVAFESTF